MAFNQILGTSSGDILVTNLPNNSGDHDIVLALGGDDWIVADFESTDYIIGGDGEDTLVPGTYIDNFIYTLPFEQFSIREHPGIDDGYLLTCDYGTETVINLVKGIEIFLTGSVLAQ